MASKRSMQSCNTAMYIPKLQKRGIDTLSFLQSFALSLCFFDPLASRQITSARGKDKWLVNQSEVMEFSGILTNQTCLLDRMYRVQMITKTRAIKLVTVSELKKNNTIVINFREQQRHSYYRTSSRGMDIVQVQEVLI